ncbi:MAG: hypothetical protein WCT46_05915 [Candidatus Gracilibacteria bacterium]
MEELRIGTGIEIGKLQVLAETFLLDLAPAWLKDSAFPEKTPFNDPEKAAPFNPHGQCGVSTLLFSEFLANQGVPLENSSICRGRVVVNGDLVHDDHIWLEFKNPDQEQIFLVDLTVGQIPEIPQSLYKGHMALVKTKTDLETAGVVYNTSNVENNNTSSPVESRLCVLRGRLNAYRARKQGRGHLARDDFKPVGNPVLLPLKQYLLEHRELRDLLSDPEIDPIDLCLQIVFHLTANALQDVVNLRNSDQRRLCDGISSLDFSSLASFPTIPSSQYNWDLIMHLAASHSDRIRKKDAQCFAESSHGKEQVFHSVDEEVSERCATDFHYLHENRLDSVGSYGMFLEGGHDPFAWVAYSPVNRQYKKELLWECGFPPDDFLELTRAWNCPGAPQNTISRLFSRSRRAEMKKRPRGLKGIISAVNPNFFLGSSFRGSDFVPVGLKPTQLKFLSTADGPLYITRRNFRQLSFEDQQTVFQSPFPLLPTWEMVSLVGVDSVKFFAKSPLAIISPSDYEQSEWVG